MGSAQQPMKGIKLLHRTNKHTLAMMIWHNMINNPTNPRNSTITTKRAQSREKGGIKKVKILYQSIHAQPGNRSE